MHSQILSYPKVCSANRGQGHQGTNWFWHLLSQAVLSLEEARNFPSKRFFNGKRNFCKTKTRLKSKQNISFCGKMFVWPRMIFFLLFDSLKISKHFILGSTQNYFLNFFLIFQNWQKIRTENPLFCQLCLWQHVSIFSYTVYSDARSLTPCPQIYWGNWLTESLTDVSGREVLGLGNTQWGWFC